jgi:hypothetical protein
MKPATCAVSGASLFPHRINSGMNELRYPWGPEENKFIISGELFFARQDARRKDSRSYLTDEQRSLAEK